MAGLSPQLTNMAIMLFFFQASKKIPFDDPNVLNGVRAVYVLSNLIMFGLYMYITKKIDDKKGSHIVLCFSHYFLLTLASDMTTLKYVEPAQMGSQEDPKLVTTTIHAYDRSQLQTGLKGQLVGIAIMGFMHLYLKYTNPLLVQSILPIKGVLEGNLAKIHLFGKPASGDLKRPWKASGGLMGALQGQGAGNEIKTDKASVEAAERAGRGGAKEE